NTDDMRDSPSPVVVPALQGEGAHVRAFDPEGMKEAKSLLPGVEWCDGPYEVAENVDALVLLTEWNMFRGLDLRRLQRLMKEPLVIDLRNVFDPVEMEKAGFAYTGIGRGRSKRAISSQPSSDIPTQAELEAIIS
ncbi:MAG: UDP binding domain-containing protein, partial [Pseudomonadota bacterium]